MGTRTAVDYANTESITRVPDPVARHVRTRVLDTLAATTAGYRFDGGRVARTVSAAVGAGDAATILDGSGDRLSLEGATLANATAANVLDVDDGHRAVKGHPAATVVPPALAAAEAEGATVGAFLDAVLVGYELGVRAGIAMHETSDFYSGSGSWGALGAAVAVARLRGLDDASFANALSTAAYHAPRTPIMRGVERPGMTKDGIGWGAMVGAASVRMAAHGFTGSGTVFDDGGWLDSLGEEYFVASGSLKPYPCCRWAQPGVDAARTLVREHGLAAADVEAIAVYTFEEAMHLETRRPNSVEAAEYSYPYPVAATVVRGQFTPAALRPAVRTAPTVLDLADRVTMLEDDELNARFPEECLARVSLATSEGTFSSQVTRPRGARDRPLTTAEWRKKAESLLGPTVDEEAAAPVEATLHRLDRPIGELLDPWRPA